MNDQPTTEGSKVLRWKLSDGGYHRIKDMADFKDPWSISSPKRSDELAHLRTRTDTRGIHRRIIVGRLFVEIVRLHFAV